MSESFKFFFISSLIFLQFSLANANYLEVTPTLYWFQYREFSPSDQLLDEEKGVIPGLKINFNDSAEGLNIQSHASLYSGEITYTKLPDSSIPFVTDTQEQLINLGLKLMPASTGAFPVYLFIGFQYWNWDRDIQSRNNVQGLHEIYNWYELELGLKFTTKNIRQPNYWLDISALYVIHPVMQLNLDSEKVKLHLGSKPGVRIRTGTTWGNEEGVSSSLNLFTEYWEFGRSNTVYVDDFFGQPSYLTEPRSESFHYGVELSVKFHF